MNIEAKFEPTERDLVIHHDEVNTLPAIVDKQLQTRFTVNSNSDISLSTPGQTLDLLVSTKKSDLLDFDSMNLHLTVAGEKSNAAGASPANDAVISSAYSGVGILRAVYVDIAGENALYIQNYGDYDAMWKIIYEKPNDQNRPLARFEKTVADAFALAPLLTIAGTQALGTAGQQKLILSLKSLGLNRLKDIMFPSGYMDVRFRFVFDSVQATNMSNPRILAGGYATIDKYTVDQEVKREMDALFANGTYRLILPSATFQSNTMQNTATLVNYNFNHSSSDVEAMLIGGRSTTLATGFSAVCAGEFQLTHQGKSQPPIPADVDTLEKITVDNTKTMSYPETCLRKYSSAGAQNAGANVYYFPLMKLSKYADEYDLIQGVNSQVSDSTFSISSKWTGTANANLQVYFLHKVQVLSSGGVARVQK